MSKITLYTYAMSPYGMKVYWALIYKKLSFDVVYVNPFRQQEIAFTGQKVVPVLQVNDVWRLDSTPICQWLDQLFPERPVCGSSAADLESILHVDAWITSTLLAAFFRYAIDGENFLNRAHMGRQLAHVMSKTVRGMPPGVGFIWPWMLKTVGFVQRDARRTQQFATLHALNEHIIMQLEGYLKSSTFLATTEQPSFADFAAYGQIHAAIGLLFRDAPHYVASPLIKAWLQRLQMHWLSPITPVLIPSIPASIPNILLL